MSGDELRSVLQSPPGRKVLFLFVGNSLRGDDGAGPYLYGILKDRVKKAELLDAGDRPESAYDRASAVQPGKVILIDAADFGGKPGEIRVIEEQSVGSAPLSTHRFPPTVITGLLKADTGCEAVILGIQPSDTAIGEGLSDAVRAAADRLAEVIRSLYH